MVAAACDIEDREEICRLTGTGQHGCGTALHGSNFLCHQVTGRIGKAGIHVAVRLEVEELAHIGAGVIFIGCALVNRKLARFSVFRLIAAVQSDCFDALFFHCCRPP